MITMTTLKIDRKDSKNNNGNMKRTNKTIKEKINRNTITALNIKTALSIKISK